MWPTIKLVWQLLGAPTALSWFLYASSRCVAADLLPQTILPAMALAHHYLQQYQTDSRKINAYANGHLSTCVGATPHLLKVCCQHPVSQRQQWPCHLLLELHLAIQQPG